MARRASWPRLFANCLEPIAEWGVHFSDLGPWFCRKLTKAIMLEAPACSRRAVFAAALFRTLPYRQSPKPRQRHIAKRQR